MIFKNKKFSDLTPNELYGILLKRNEVFVIEQNIHYQDCDNKDKNAYHLFFQENDEIIAYLRILEKGVSYPKLSIGRVLVCKNRRGQNLGRKILEKAIDFIENELNEVCIKISAQKYLKDFYQSLGFKTVSDIYIEEGIEHIKMVRENIR